MREEWLLSYSDYHVICLSYESENENERVTLILHDDDLYDQNENVSKLFWFSFS